MGDGRGDFDTKHAGDADEEASDALVVSVRTFRVLAAPRPSALAASLLRWGLTVIALPSINPARSPVSPLIIAHNVCSSLLTIIAGTSAIAPIRFCQYAKSMVLPSTCFSAVLINTACRATIAADINPSTIPSTGASLRVYVNTAGPAPAVPAAPPTGHRGMNVYANPYDTQTQLAMVYLDGIELVMMLDRTTVSGSVRPRAT